MYRLSWAEFAELEPGHIYSELHAGDQVAQGLFIKGETRYDGARPVDCPAQTLLPVIKSGRPQSCDQQHNWTWYQGMTFVIWEDDDVKELRRRMGTVAAFA